jgi:hypothetical protein
MKVWVCILVIPIAPGFSNAVKLNVGRDSVAFTAKLADSTLRKQVSLRGELPRNSPFNNYLKYDSTRLKIFSIRGTATPSDSIQGDSGILSQRWGVKDGNAARYLNISDLKKLGLKGIGPAEIAAWITSGRLVTSSVAFLKFAAELKRDGIIGQDFPPDFMPTEIRTIMGFRYLTVTIFNSPDFVQYRYFISPENEVMLWKYENLFKVRFPKYIPLAVMPGVFMLKNSADTVAERRSDRYMELIGKYESLLLR